MQNSRENHLPSYLNNQATHNGPISINISLEDLLDNKDNIKINNSPKSTLIDVLNYIDNSNDKIQKLLYQVSTSRHYCHQLMNSFYQ